MQGVSFGFSECAFTKAMGINRDIDGDDGAWVHSSRVVQAISRMSRDARDILRSPTSV